jgi:uncharacterized membrane protein YeaQ/YmgE (transglycosylase-associated protein family)
MVRYDPDVIQEFAEGLYRKARGIILSHTLLGILVGAVAGFAVGAASSHGRNGIPNMTMFLTLVGALLFGAFGYSIGVQRSFYLRLQAQTALCQRQIEENTRLAPVAQGGRGQPDELKQRAA